uniref:Uncharacterized protein n=1 Tax=Anguilla anguilla TaxID=7936 RepID=A0A0E9PP56_ANGAN
MGGNGTWLLNLIIPEKPPHPPYTDLRVRLFLSGSRNSSTSASVTLHSSSSMLEMSLRIPQEVNNFSKVNRQ